MRKALEFMCLMFTAHEEVKNSTEDLGEGQFRYITTCRCGKHVMRSVPLTQNDLIADKNINKHDYPVDAFTEWVYTKQRVKYQQDYNFLIISIFIFTYVMIAISWCAYDLYFDGLVINPSDKIVALILSLSITINATHYLKIQRNKR